jgi:hypothetical protein
MLPSEGDPDALDAGQAREALRAVKALHARLAADLRGDGGGGAAAAARLAGTSDWRDFAGALPGSAAAAAAAAAASGSAVGVQMTGVKVLGYGKDGTIVYTADQLLRVHPRASWVEVGACGARRTERLELRHMGERDVARATARLRLTDAMAVKDVRDEEDARDEATVHAFLYSCFARKARMRYCILHPTVCSLRVDGHVLLPMRRFRSTASVLVGACSVPTGLALAEHVLQALCVLHENELLHLDIKPSNVLIWSSAHSERFVLGDYDIVARVDDVVELIRGGGLYGTTGFVSPVMAGPKLHPRYVRCCTHVSAACERLKPSVPGMPANLEAWQGLFARMRKLVMTGSQEVARSVVHVCDMHCLATTLFDLLGESAFAGSSQNTLAATTLIAGLLAGNVANAANAATLVKLLRQPYTSTTL